MGDYQHDMSKEKEKGLWLEGWREFEIVECVEHTSKAGNEGFKFTFSDAETYQENDIYATAVPKKRWFLKSILKACGVPASQDGVYDWSISDVKGKFIRGRVEHYPDEWVNRDSKTVVTTKHKVAEIKAMSEEVPQVSSKDEKEMQDLLENSDSAKHTDQAPF